MREPPVQGEEAGEMKKTFKANAKAKAATKPARKPATKTVAKRSAVSVTKAVTKKAKAGTKSGTNQAAAPSKLSKPSKKKSAPARGTTVTKTKVTQSPKHSLTGGKQVRASDPRQIKAGRTADPRQIKPTKTAGPKSAKTALAAATKTATKTKTGARSSLTHSTAADAKLKHGSNTKADPAKRSASASPARTNTQGLGAAKKVGLKRKSGAARAKTDAAQLQLVLGLDATGQTPATPGTGNGAKPKSDKPTLTRYALLLRGVNVGGPTNVLPMVELRDMLDEIGCTHVQTYLQSGNAVFSCTRSPEEITKDIERLLEQFMGRHIATTLRTQAELKSILAANPFQDIATDPQFLTVTFLTASPTEQELAPLHEKSFEPELFKVSGQEIFMWQPNGQARSNLAFALGRLPLRGTYTTRNWNTVTKLSELLESSN
jgi:uncharacterized protein (DUF1697 family)